LHFGYFAHKTFETRRSYGILGEELSCNLDYAVLTHRKEVNVLVIMQKFNRSFCTSSS